MVYTNCYYYLKGKVIFVSQCVMKHGEMFLYVYNCERITDSSDLDMDNIYHPIGNPTLIYPDELGSANNLCINCLSCKYLSVENPIGLMNGEQKVQNLKCSLHGKTTVDYFSEILANCEYQYPQYSYAQIEPVREPPISDLKEYIKDVKRRNKPTVLLSKYYCMPPNVFLVLKSILGEDDLVYFGTGTSAVDVQYGVWAHENLEEYLNFPGKDYRMVCYRAGDVSDELYIKLTSDWFGDSPLYNVVCIPAIDFACYGDEEIDDYHSGYIFYAQQEITEALKKEHENTDWSKYVPDLLKD